MKTKKVLSLLIAIGMIMTLSPIAVFSEGEETRRMEVVVKEGESFSVWNTDTGSGLVSSNDISVYVSDDTEYDIVFPENATTAAALSTQSEGVSWSTSDYIKPDKAKPEGMLVWISVQCGEAVLVVTSHGSESMETNPLSLYEEEGSPLSYSTVTCGQVAEYILPADCSLSNITLVMCGTLDAEIKRTIGADSNSYELYQFGADELLCRVYADGILTKTISIPCDSMMAGESEIYYCTTVLFPSGLEQANLGIMKMTEGNAIFALPEIPSALNKNSAEWSVNNVLYNAPVAYSPKYEMFFDDTTQSLYTTRAEEKFLALSLTQELEGPGSPDPEDPIGSPASELRARINSMIVAETTDTLKEKAEEAKRQLKLELENETKKINSFVINSPEFTPAANVNIPTVNDPYEYNVVTNFEKPDYLVKLNFPDLSKQMEEQMEEQLEEQMKAADRPLISVIQISRNRTNKPYTPKRAISLRKDQDPLVASVLNRINTETPDPSGENGNSGNDGTSEIQILNGTGNAEPETCRIYINGGNADRATAIEDDVVNLTATVPDGKRFVAWSSIPDITFNKSAPITSAVIPGGTQSVCFIAETAPIEYGITVNACVGGSLEAEKSESAAGKKITVSAIPDEGYALTSLSAYADGSITLTQSGNDPNIYSFTMPAKAVTVSAEFEKIPYFVETSAEYGTLVTDNQNAGVGDTVTLSVSTHYIHRHLGLLIVTCNGENVPVTKIDENTYTFTMPAGNVSAKAVYVGNAIVYFRNRGGRLLSWGEYNVGETPVYSGATPEAAPDDMYTYTFAGWDRNIEPIGINDEEVVYTATYTPTRRSYTVSFLGADGSALQSGSVLYGETPAYAGETPSADPDDYYIYTFSHWTPEITAVTKDAVYEPVFAALPVLGERMNSISLEKNDEVVFSFTPEKDGWYRFRSAGEEIHPNCSLRDENGDYVDKYYDDYNTDGIFNFEFVVELEGGKHYEVPVEAMRASGSISLFIKKVDMHTVTIDRDIENGTVIGEDPVSYMAYTGQIIYPYAMPDPGYGLVKIIATDENGKRLLEDEGGYVMPDSNVSVTAVFAPARVVDLEGIGMGIGFSNNETVFTDYSGEDPVDCAAIGSGVEFSFEWNSGNILEEFSLKTESGKDVPYGERIPYANRLEIWFTMPDENVSLTAQITDSCAINFSPGTVDGKSIRLITELGEEIYIPECLFSTPRDKAFDGWSTLENGPVEYAPGDTFSPNGDITLYAVWRPREYTETTVTKEAGNTVCDVSLNNTTGPVTVIAAAYLNGVLVTAEPRVTSQSAETFTFTGNPDTLKVFVFDSLNNLKPLSVVEEKVLK